jgi:hydroxyacylglutathione hydrolase
MSIQRIVNKDLAINTYLIIDPKTHIGCVIDPPRIVDELCTEIESTKAQVCAILETHVHADFVSGARELKERLHGKPQIYSSCEGGEEWTASYADKQLHDGECIAIGSQYIQACHTPGHTPEHMMYVLYDEGGPLAAFTGDFLFVGSVGRPDLLGNEALEPLAKALYRSIFEILPRFEASLQILPSHTAGSLCGKGISREPSSTLGRERECNPFLIRQDQSEWIRNLLKGMPEAPIYFTRIKKQNVQGFSLLKDLAPPMEVPYEELRGQQIVDIRSKEAFAKGHIQGALNIPWGGSFLHWSASILNDEIATVIISETEDEALEAIRKLTQVGLDKARGYAIYNKSIALGGLVIDSFLLISCVKACGLMEEEGSDVLILDVRTNAERAAGHIPGSMGIELAHLENKLALIPGDKIIGLICGSGYRASIAASILQKHGYGDVFNVEGGMEAWKEAGLPLTSSHDIR